MQFAPTPPSPPPPTKLPSPEPTNVTGVARDAPVRTDAGLIDVFQVAAGLRDPHAATSPTVAMPRREPGHSIAFIVPPYSLRLLETRCAMGLRATRRSAPARSLSAPWPRTFRTPTAVTRADRRATAGRSAARSVLSCTKPSPTREMWKVCGPEASRTVVSMKSLRAIQCLRDRQTQYFNMRECHHSCVRPTDRDLTQVVDPHGVPPQTGVGRPVRGRPETTWPSRRGSEDDSQPGLRGCLS